MEPLLVYFSSGSKNTHRFVGKLNMPSMRIPLSPQEPQPVVDRPYILVCPTYAGDDGQGAVPRPVINFLKIKTNAENIIGVIASGNRNFGKYFAYAGNVISAKMQVPCLYKFELMGTQEDVKKVNDGVEKVWQQLLKSKEMIA